MAVAKSYPGFTAQSFTKPRIALNGSTVVNIYYNRNEIEYTFQLYGGSINNVSGNKTVTLRYGIPVAKPTNPSKEHYTFINWYSDSSLKNLYDFDSTPSENTTIYAGWKYIPIQAKEKITIDATQFDKTEEIYVIDPAKTGDDITVIEGKTYISSNTYGPFRKDRTVSLSPFIMGKYEVTQELYTYVMKDQVFTINGTDYTLNASPFGCLETGNHPLVSGEDQSLRPADSVTWYDAVYFCNKLSEKLNLTPVYNISEYTFDENGDPIFAKVDADGHITYAPVTYNQSANGYRLPTEAEWEFAFRGGNPLLEAWDYLFSGSPGAEGVSYTASSNSGLDSVGWYMSNSSFVTHEVGLKDPNTLGIYDMSGNVSEWCYDWQTLMGTGDFINPVAGSHKPNDDPNAIKGSVKMMRGGNVHYTAGTCTNCARVETDPAKTDYAYGIRLVRSVSN